MAIYYILGHPILDSQVTVSGLKCQNLCIKKGEQKNPLEIPTT